MKLGELALLLFALAALLPCGTALRLPAAVARRQALLVRRRAPRCCSSLVKSKKSMNSNKQEGVGAAMGEEYPKKMFAEEKLAMAGDKGMRGTKIDPNLRVNEQRTGTVYVGGQKKVTADRNRDPAELGLKQWSGTSGPTTWR